MLDEKINPLEYLGVRRLEIAAAHLSYIDFTDRASLWNNQTYHKWIKDNLKGRYYFGFRPILDHNNKMTIALCFGFEIPSELTIFTISGPMTA